MDDQFDQWQDAEVIPPATTDNTTSQQVKQQQTPILELTIQSHPLPQINPTSTAKQPQQQQFVFDDVVASKPQQQPAVRQTTDNAFDILGMIQTPVKSQPQIQISDYVVPVGDYLGLNKLTISTVQQPVQPLVQYQLAVEQDDWILPNVNNTNNHSNMGYDPMLGPTKSQPIPTSQPIIDNNINHPIPSMQPKVDDDWQWQGAPVTATATVTNQVNQNTATGDNLYNNQIPVSVASVQPALQPEQDQWVQSCPVIAVQPTNKQEQQQNKPNDEQQWEYSSAPVQHYQQYHTTPPLQDLTPSFSQKVVENKVEDDDGFGDYEGNNVVVLNPQPVLTTNMKQKIAAFLDNLPDYSYIGASCFMQI